MALVYLGIGTNLGDRETNLNQAMVFLRERVGEIYNVSSFYTSKPWNFSSGNDFSNAVLLMSTSLSPQQLLVAIKKIERKMGRVYNTNHVYEDRIIDIDILLYENLVIEQKHLIIPQKQMAEREFVLFPLAEIAPDFLHPLTNKTILEMKNEWLQNQD